MKKTAIIVSLILTMSLAGCGSSSSKTTSNEQSDKTISSTVEKVEEKTESSVAQQVTEKPQEKNEEPVSDENNALKKELKEKYDITKPEKFVRGDATGNWRLVRVANATPPSDYAVDYARCYMTGENVGVHFIVNFSLGTTTQLSLVGGILDAITTEYVDNEEHDASAIGNGMVLTERYFDMETGEEVTTDADENAGTVDSDTLIATVREAIDGAVGEGETITDVSFDGTNLNISVDMSGVTDSPLPVEIIAESRVSSITDEILALDDSYYNTWETVTVDFGDIGRIVCDKSMVKDEGYGKFFEVPLGVFDK